MSGADRDADLAYARCLAAGTAIAFALIVAELAAYLSGLVSPAVPLRDLPSLWSLPLKDYLAATKAPTGWHWLALVGRGDYLNFIGIALLCSVTAVAYACTVARYRAAGDRLHAAIAAAQLAVLLAAASGLLN